MPEIFLTLRIAFLVCVFSLRISTGAPAQEAGLYDHHIHLLSTTLINDWKSIGMEFSRADEAYNDATLLLNKEQLAGAFLISMAHLYTTEDFRPLSTTPSQEQRLVAAENDFIASCVAKHPTRFVGFFSVNPMADYALEELKRCKSNPKLTGLKIHLPACGVQLNNQAHVNRLHTVLMWAADNDVPVLMHLTAGEEIDIEQSLQIWKSLIQPHRNLELYLAHLGSAGGYGDSAFQILEGFRQLADQDSEFQNRKIYFDLSGAIIPNGSQEASPTSEAQCKRLSDQIRQIGVHRFLFASDYPVFPISSTRSSLLDRLTLEPHELDELLNNRSPRFKVLK